MKKKSLMQNFLYNSVYQVAALLTPVITTPYISRVLSVNGIGRYSVASSIVTYFTLACTMGTTTYGQRIIGGNQEDPEKRSRFFWEILILRFLTSSITYIVFLSYVVFFSEDKLLALITSMNILGVFVDITWFFQGMEEFKKITVRNLSFKLINLVLLFVFVKEPADLYRYAFIMCSCALTGNLFMWKDIKKYLVKVKNIKPFRNLGDIWLLFLPTIATHIYTVLDKTMIGWITKSNYENGCYEQAEKIVRMSLSVISALSGVLFPRISLYFEKRNWKELERNLQNAFKATFLISIPLAVGIAAISDLFVPVFLGVGYDDVSGLMKIFSLLAVFVGSAQIVGYSYLIPTKQQNVYTKVETGSAFANLGLNIILIPRLGAYGAAISSVVAEGIGVFMEFGYVLKKHQIKAYAIFGGIWKYLVSAVVMGLVVRILVRAVPESAASLAAVLASGVIMYCCGILCLKDDFMFRTMIPLVTQKLRLKK